VIVLSEVNPLGNGGGLALNPCQSIKEQAEQWYGIHLKSNEFVESILELENICELSNRHLIVRDWSFVNFAPCAENKYKPPKKLMSLVELSKVCEVRPFAFVRDSIDVWISRNTPDLEFFSEYLDYVQALISSKIPYFKYEDFCENPEDTFKQICSHLGVEYNDSFKEYQLFSYVNGDNQIISRGNQEKAIQVLPRKILPYPKIFKVNNCASMIEANCLLDYPTSYYGRKRESLVYKMLRKLF